MSRGTRSGRRTRSRPCSSAAAAAATSPLLMMEAVRSLGLAARFVSGYLYVAGIRRRERVGGGATHAWLEVYLPGAGWVEYDPTNGVVGNRDLIRVAVVRDPRQAVPLSGTWTGFPSDFLGMTVDVAVTPDGPEEVARVGRKLNPSLPTAFPANETVKGDPRSALRRRARLEPFGLVSCSRDRWDDRRRGS